jgi:hypothetical protein
VKSKALKIMNLPGSLFYNFQLVRMNNGIVQKDGKHETIFKISDDFWRMHIKMEVEAIPSKSVCLNREISSLAVATGRFKALVVYAVKLVCDKPAFCSKRF